MQEDFGNRNIYIRIYPTSRIRLYFPNLDPRYWLIFCNELESVSFGVISGTTWRALPSTAQRRVWLFDRLGFRQAIGAFIAERSYN